MNSASAESMTCQYMSAVDGDTLVVDCGGSPELVHLAGLVAPPLVTGSDEACMNHPLAEVSRLNLADVFKHDRFQDVVIEPIELNSGDSLDEAGEHAEINAVVKVGPVFAQKTMNHSIDGPLYAMFSFPDGLSLDQYVKGYASLVREHKDWVRFEAIKVLFNDAKKRAIESLMQEDKTFVYQAIPEVCSTSALMWQKLSQNQRCQIQKACEGKTESNLDQVWKFLNW